MCPPLFILLLRQLPTSPSLTVPLYFHLRRHTLPSFAEVKYSVWSGSNVTILAGNKSAFILFQQSLHSSYVQNITCVCCSVCGTKSGYTATARPEALSHIQIHILYLWVDHSQRPLPCVLYFCLSSVSPRTPTSPQCPIKLFNTNGWIHKQTHSSHF